MASLLARPREYGKAKYKATILLLQMDVNIDTRQPEYNASVEAARQLSTLSLRSTTVECPTSLAAAFVEGDRLVLVPLDEVTGAEEEVVKGGCIRRWIDDTCVFA